MLIRTGILLLLLFVYDLCQAQPCTTLGQNPSTAFPVCGTTTFHQNEVPICSSTSLYVPGCSGTGNVNYENKNPFWYRFTCYVSGTLSFVISPVNQNDDYDWQLYDITGLNPDEVYTNHNIIVAGNWSATPGNTGASANGVTYLQCASSPSENRPTFARSPNLIAGHDYILLISHYTDSQSGYNLSFNGGTAVITDPADPHLLKVTPNCDGSSLVVKLNKKMKCSSLTGSGSEFSIFPAVATVVSATTATCTSGFNMDEIILTLSNPIPGGTYQLIINNGTDGNTLLDNCDRNIPEAEQISFVYDVPQPIPIDSVGNVGCAPDKIRLHFSKRISCNTIAPDGSNFTITGTTPVTITGAAGDNCLAGLSDVIVLQLGSPLYLSGSYMVTPHLSVNGGAVIDECGQIIQPRPVSFTTVDTVYAGFSHTNVMGCRFDTLTFFHNGAHGVNQWNWTFNSSSRSDLQSPTMVFPATSTNTVQLVVSNGVCRDTVTQQIVLDNEVIAGFDMPADICPEDVLSLPNTSKGQIDIWQWDFSSLGSSNLKDPAPLHFIQDNRERVYMIRLTVTNTLLGCSDAVTKRLRVLNNCFIAVPTGFTPNGDGLNDYLYPNNALKADKMRFSIYNRWGQLMFSTSSWLEKWDGRVNGIPQPSGVYVWYLQYTHRDTGKEVFQKGTSTLIR